MVEIKKPNGHWSLERLKVEALKYSSRQEFQQKNGAAYKAAGEIKCRDEICAHMAKVKQPKGYWSIENCNDPLNSCSGHNNGRIMK